MIIKCLYCKGTGNGIICIPDGSSGTHGGEGKK